MSFKKINVDKLLDKLSTVSIEQRSELHEKLGAQIDSGKEEYIAKMQARIDALRSGKSVAEVAKEDTPAPKAKKGKKGQEATAEAEAL